MNIQVLSFNDAKVTAEQNALDEDANHESTSIT